MKYYYDQIEHFLELLQDYNQKRHLELLKLKNSNKDALTSEEQEELRNYSILIDLQLDWETRNQYLDMIDRLLSKEIGCFKFYLEFNERSKLNGNVDECLKENNFLLLPQKRAIQFHDFFVQILQFCDFYIEAFESDSYFEKKQQYELEFQNFFGKLNPEIQKFVKEKEE